MRTKITDSNYKNLREFGEDRDEGTVRPTLTYCSREGRGLRRAALPGDPNVVSAPNLNFT